MATLSILRNSLALNAKVITKQQVDVGMLKQETARWKAQGETAFFVSACQDLKKSKVKLAKAVALQKRIKVEIASIFRNERILRKYVLVFGAPAKGQVMTSFEQEAMLDDLLAEQATGGVAGCASLMM